MDDSIILYHFTGRDHVNGIKRTGISQGVVFNGRRLFKGFIWLTSDSRFEAQNWATNYSGLCGDRTAIRLTVRVPKSRLYHWNREAHFFGFSEHELYQFNTAGYSDGEAWYLIKAPIPKESIIEIKYRNDNGKEKE